MEIVLREDYITLGQVLKVAGIAQTGGEAKMLLAQSTIFINGERDNRRGRKLYAGDVVLMEGEPEIKIMPKE